MTIHYNKTSEKSNRRKLRRNQTEAEKIVWCFLRNRRMLDYKFRRQYSVDKYVIDFYCPELKLAIEIDGSIHNLPAQKLHDEIRQEYLEKNFKIRFLRITNEEVLCEPRKTREKIRNFIYNL